MEEAIVTTASTAANVLFYSGVACAAVGFGCAIAENFVNEKVKKVLNWITIGCILAGTACFIAYDVMK